MFPLLNVVASLRAADAAVPVVRAADAAVPVVRPQEGVVASLRAADAAVPAIEAPVLVGGQRNRRKCSHCREEGHNINRCPTLDTFVEELYHRALVELQQDVNNRQGGYYFENWVLNLSNRDMQYLVWRCQQHQHAQMAAEGRRTSVTRRISDVESRAIVFEHFGSLDIGYVTKSVRLARHYYEAYRAVQSDVAHEANGNEFQNYLKRHISEWQLRDIYSKILETRGLRDSPLEEREFPFLWEQWNQSRHSVLTNQEFIIHTHFASIAVLEYDFRVRNMPDYVPPDLFIHRAIMAGQAVPPRNYRRGPAAAQVPAQVPAQQPIRDSLHIRFQENQSVTLRFRKDGPYPVTYLKDYKLVKDVYTCNDDDEVIEVDEEPTEDCPICLEAKTYGHFLKMGCTHGFCNTCVGKIIATAVPKQREVHCPLCRDEMREIHYSDYSKVKTMFRKGESA